MSARGVRVEDLRRFVFVSDPQVSPDGGRVAFVHTRIDYAGDRYVKHIWMWDRETGRVEQFTYGSGSDSYPRWSPDGRWLLFLSSKRQPEKKKAQLWVIPTSGGEARLVADVEDGVMTPMWASDSKRILFLSRVWTGEKPKSDVKVVRRLKYKLNGVGLFPGKRPHLYTVKVGGRPRQLTEGEFDVDVAKWSPDGRRIALITSMAEDADLTFIRDIYLMPARGGEPERLTQGKHVITDLSWAPGGGELAFLGHDYHRRTATNTDIWVMPADGGTPLNLTESFDRSVGMGVGSDLRVATPPPGAVWAPDGSALYFIAADIPTSNIYRVDRQTGEVEEITRGKTVDGFSLSADGAVVAFNAMDATHPAELWIRDHEGERRVTDFNDRLLKKLKLSTPEHFTFTNELGMEVDGWVMKPVDFEPGRKYPAILEVHGGPRGVYGDAIYHEFHLLTAEGYVVLYTNPRGSGGYGEEYAASIIGNWGVVDYPDLMAFVDAALERFSFIDSERLGVTGGSYGGYMTNWIVTHTDRFKAAVAQRSTCNRYSFHGVSDIGYSHGAATNDGVPWKDEEKLLRQSPLRYVGNARTPTLLIHSENDLRCPMSQAEEFFVALKKVGVETELVRFPGENHELSRSGKPKHREERLRHILRWFDRHLK